MQELAEIELFDYEIAYFLDTQVNELEFNVALRKPIAPIKSKILASFPKIQEPDIRNDVEYFRPELQPQTESGDPVLAAASLKALLRRIGNTIRGK